MDQSRRVLVLLASLSLAASACSESVTDPVPVVPDAKPSLTLMPGTQADIQEGLTITGDPAVGNVINLNFNLTNVGAGDFTATQFVFGETRPRAAFGEVVIPNGFKRQVPAPNTATDNPLIICEAYRGTHGGLTQALFSDVCRVWFYGSIPAGATVTAVIPVKLLAEGDFSPWGGAEMYASNGTLIPLNNNQWISTLVHVNPAPPKGGAVGGQPDLQAGGRASTGSPARGAAFSLSMTAKNIGKVDANDPTFTTVIPAGLTVVDAGFDFGACTVSGQTVSCTSTHPVFPGMTYTAFINLVAPTAPGTFTISGIWGTSNTESSTTNNTSTATITVK